MDLRQEGAVVSTTNPIAPFELASPQPPRRRLARKSSISERAKVWSKNWSNRGNVLNFISCVSYFPLNFSHGHGVIYDARAMTALYIVLAAVNLASASCYMTEVACSGVPFWPDLVAPITGLISAILYQITSVLYMFEASSRIITAVLWAEFAASALYFADSLFYTLLWYRFQFEEGPGADTSPPAARSGRRRPISALGSDNPPPAGGQQGPAAPAEQRGGDLAARVSSELRAHFFTWAFQENAWFVGASLLYVLGTVFALAAHYFVFTGPRRSNPAESILRSQELRLASLCSAAADGVYVCQSIVLFLVGGRRMGHVAEAARTEEEAEFGGALDSPAVDPQVHDSDWQARGGGEGGGGPLARVSALFSFRRRSAVLATR